MSDKSKRNLGRIGYVGEDMENLPTLPLDVQVAMQANALSEKYKGQLLARGGEAWPGTRWPPPHPPFGSSLKDVRAFVLYSFATACGAESEAEALPMLQANLPRLRAYLVGALRDLVSAREEYLVKNVARMPKKVRQLHEQEGRLEEISIESLMDEVDAGVLADAALKATSIMEIADNKSVQAIAKIEEAVETLVREEQRQIIEEVSNDLLHREWLYRAARGDAVERKLSRYKHLSPDLREKAEHIARLRGDLGELKIQFLDSIAGFAEFCKATRGFDVPEHPADPGAFLMGLGRIFTDEEDITTEKVLGLMEALENVIPKSLKWEDIAPNAQTAYRYLSTLVEKSYGSWCVHFSRAWARDGFPTIELPHKTAAALMFSDASAQESLQIEPPWRAFVLKIPDGLITLREGKTVLRRVLVWFAPERTKTRWKIMLHLYTAMTFHVATAGMETLDPDEKHLSECIDASMDLGPDGISGEELARCFHVVARLVGGACMMVSGNEHIEEKEWSPKPSKTKNRPPGMEPPVGTRWIIGKNVEIDLREQVKEFISGKAKKGSKLTVQFVVRGHRRHQSWGPKHSLRKWIWIQPYWKGSLSGEALFRGYEFKGGDAGSQPPQDASVPVPPTEPPPQPQTSPGEALAAEKEES